MKTEGTVSSVLDQQTTNPINEGYIKTDFRLLINGRLVNGAGTLDVINPATGRALTTAPRADRASWIKQWLPRRRRSPAGRRHRSRHGGTCWSSWPRHSRHTRMNSPVFSRRSRASHCLKHSTRSPSRLPRSATSPRSTCRSRYSMRMRRRRLSGSASRSASSRRSRHGTSLCSS